MSINNYILNLLNIKDKNIFISEKIEIRKIKNVNYKIIEGVLSYKPDCCPKCGCINKSFDDIIAWWYRKNFKVKILNIFNYKSFLIFCKIKYLCKHCDKSFICETNLIDKNISNNTQLHIMLKIMKKQ